MLPGQVGKGWRKQSAKREERSKGATISGKIQRKVTCPDPMGKLGGLVTPPSCPDPKQGLCAFILLYRTVWPMTKVGMQGRCVSARHPSSPSLQVQWSRSPRAALRKRAAGTGHRKHSDGGSWGRRCREMIKWDVRVFGRSIDMAHFRHKKDLRKRIL